MDSVGVKCILCKSTNLKEETILESKLVNDIYKESYAHDFSEFFNLDSFSFYKCNRCEHMFFDPRMSGNDKFYEKLQQVRNTYYNPLRPEFFKIINYIKENDNVLEVGAGDGGFADIINCKSYLGLEFNDLAIENAKLKDIVLQKQSIEDHSLNHIEVYDVIISNHVHEHVGNLNNFITAGVRCLKKGGLYIFSVPNNQNYETSSINHTLNMPPHHISRFSNKSFKIFHIFGLELKSIETVGLSKTIEFRCRNVNSFLLKKIAALFGLNPVAISIKSLNKINKLVDFIPNVLKLVIYKVLFNKEGLNTVVVFKKR